MLSKYLLTSLLTLIAMSIIPALAVEEPASDKNDASSRGWKVKDVELDNGIRLNYAEQGDEDGIPVILLHGWTDSRRTYELMLPHLPSSLHVYALSLRGHGDSDCPESGFLPKDFADDMYEFMDAVNLDAAVIVGHSMGSIAAQQFAVNYPERVTGLVLIGSAASIADVPVLNETMKSVGDLEDPISPDFVRAFQVELPMQPVPEEFLEITIQETLKVPAKVWKLALAGLLTRPTPAIDRITAPTLVIYGGKDVFIPRTQQDALVRSIAGSKLRVYDSAGHCLQWEEPKRLATDLTEFIVKTSGGAR